MARRTAADIDSALQDGARVVYVHGDAALLVERDVESAEAWGLERCGLPAFNHGRWRASDDRAEEAVSTARTLPMMADLRVVVLRDLHEARDDLASAVVDYMKEPSPTTLFIAVAGSFPKPRKGHKRWSTRLTNAAKAHGIEIKRDSKGVDRGAFARDHAGRLGVELAPREAALLVELVGDDLGRLAQELEKVATFLGGSGRVTPEALQEVCSVVAEEIVWELTSGIARRDAPQAVRSLHRLLADGKNEHYLFAMVCMQLRKVLQATQMLRRGAPGAAVGRTVRLRRDELSVVEAIARREDRPEPARVLEQLAAANRAMNRHPAGSKKVLEALVVDLCAG